MNYPLIIDYVKAIKLAEDNLEQLSYLRPVLDISGNPVMSCGNFAVVFKMKDEQDGKFYALKCFIKDQEGRKEAYKLIADELEYVSTDFITSINYLEKELFVETGNCDVSEFPVLLMDWVEGVTLDKYIREHLNDQYSLRLVTFQFCRLAAWLMAQTFAHGDLKPDNILVKNDGSLVMVDYDGMFVPAMKGQKAREIGSPDYRHPLRTINDFNENIDDFSLATIAMQLYSVALQPDLMTDSSGDSLLLCEKDYRNLEKSEMMSKLFLLVGNPEFEKLLAIFLLAHSERTLSKLSFRIFNINKPEKPIANLHLSTEVTNEDLANVWSDEHGALYSKDKKRLLSFGSYIETGIYEIKNGTLVVCDLAFTNFENDNHYLKGVYIPASVIAIGEGAFSGCVDFIIDCDSPFFVVEDGLLYDRNYSRLFANTKRVEELIIQPSVDRVEAYSLSYCVARKIQLPDNLSYIGEFSFALSDFEFIIIPNSVLHIGRRSFMLCRNLSDICVFGSHTEIDETAFEDCQGLKHIFVLANRVNYYTTQFPEIAEKFIGIGDIDDVYVDKAIFADEIFKLGKSYWKYKNSEIKDFNEAVRLYEISAELEHEEAQIEFSKLGKYWFDNNIALYSKDKKIVKGLWSCYINEYRILEGTQIIDDEAFCDLGSEVDYSYLEVVEIPSSVTSIGSNPFNKYLSKIICKSPYFVVDEDTLFTKDKKRLIQSFAKTKEYAIPKGVLFIDNHAFYGCRSNKIIIPASVQKIGINPFIEMEADDNTLEVISLSPKFKIEGDALYEENTKLISYWGKDSSFTVPNGIKEIGEYAFFASELRTINLPGSIERIGDCAFGWCFSLNNVLVPEAFADKFKRIMKGYQGMIRIE